MGPQEFHDFLKIDNQENLNEREKIIFKKYRPQFKNQINDTFDYVRNYFELKYCIRCSQFRP